MVKVMILMVPLVFIRSLIVQLVMLEETCSVHPVSVSLDCESCVAIIVLLNHHYIITAMVGIVIVLVMELYHN